MNHLLILPVLIPMFLGCILLLPMPLQRQRWVLILGTLALVPVSAVLLQTSASGDLQLYALGNWAPPFGIALVLDRLSALMLSVVAVLASFSAIYAVRGDDEIGAFFHPLFAFQLMGLNGAFLTGDLFNLFVFFEIMLIASYALLLHGVGVLRVNAGTHYVLLNLIGSTIFLFGLGVIYGTAGTLNMADLSLKVAAASPEQQPLYAAAGLLLLVVFGLKAAMLPLYFWLPRAYSSASAPVAALFAVMTKVGLYAMLRVFTLVYGSSAGALEGLASTWLWPLGLLTIAFGAIGVLAAPSLKVLIAYAVVVSAGTLQASVAMGTAASISAALFYLVHSTAIGGAFFLLADLIARERGEKRTRLIAGPPLRHSGLFGLMFFAAAISIAGLPPLSGFFGKVSILMAAPSGSEQRLVWTVLLLGGLASMIALSRAGSTLIWRTKDKQPTSVPMDRVRFLAALGLLACSPLLVVFAQPIFSFMEATAAQLLDVELYHQLVLNVGGTP